MQVKFGDKGSLVEAFQVALIRSGFLSQAPDGIFGETTRNAVIRFQMNFGLTPDGIIGPATEEVISRFLKGYFIKTINRGDTLWKIAIDTGISVLRIITANPDIDKDNLQIGQKIIVPYDFSLTPTDISYSYYLVQNIIEGLKARYPFINLSSIGKSVMLKDIIAVTVGKGNKELFINAGFHANEWLNIPTVLKFLEEYLDAIIKDKDFCGFNAKSLFYTTKLHVVPLVNPDGLDLVTKALTTGEYYDQAVRISEDYPAIPFPEGWKANINGVDLNLQFPAQWDRAKEIKYSQGFISPSPIEYVGNEPLSEPEAKAIYDYTVNNNFKLILAYHSQGEIIYWKYADFLPPDSQRIGEILSEASGYPLELTPPDSSFAGYKDWFIQEYNRPGYTVETGLGKNPLPIEQTEDIYEKNKKLIISAVYETSLLL